MTRERLERLKIQPGDARLSEILELLDEIDRLRQIVATLPKDGELNRLTVLLSCYDQGADDGFGCRLCHEIYDCHPDCEPSVLCNACAQDAAQFMTEMFKRILSSCEAAMKGGSGS